VLDKYTHNLYSKYFEYIKLLIYFHFSFAVHNSFCNCEYQDILELCDTVTNTLDKVKNGTKYRKIIYKSYRVNV
jgi:hypothetical protein